MHIGGESSSLGMPTKDEEAEAVIAVAVLVRRGEDEEPKPEAEALLTRRIAGAVLALAVALGRAAG